MKVAYKWRFKARCRKEYKTVPLLEYKPDYINNIQNIIQKQQMKILQNNRKGISKCQNIKQYGQQ